MDHGLWLKDVLVFLAAAGIIVPLFHRARIGAVLGFLLVGVLVGPYGLGRLTGDFPWLRYLTIEDRAPGRDPGRARRRVPAVPDRAGAVGGAAVVAAPLCARHRRAAVRALRARHRRGCRRGRSGHEQRDRARPLPRHVLDRHGHAAARGRRPLGHAGRPHRALGAAVPGPHGRSGPVRRRRARPRRPARRAGARRRAAAGGRRGGGDHRRRPLPAAADLPVRRPDRQPRADHGDDAVHGDRDGRRHRLTPGSRARSAHFSPACCCRRPNTAIRSRSISRRSKAC